MVSTKKTEGKTTTDGVRVTETQEPKLEFVDGKVTKESMLLVIPSLLSELDQNELSDIYGTVWNMTAVKLLYRLSKSRVEELKKEIQDLKGQLNALRESAK